MGECVRMCAGVCCQWQNGWLWFALQNKFPQAKREKWALYSKMQAESRSRDGTGKPQSGKEGGEGRAWVKLKEMLHNYKSTARCQCRWQTHSSSHTLTHTQPHTQPHTHSCSGRTMQLPADMKNYFTAAFTAASICLLPRSVCASPQPTSSGWGTIQPSLNCFWAQFFWICLLILIYDFRALCFPSATLSLRLCRRLSTIAASWENWLIAVEGSTPALREHSLLNPLQACQVKQGMQQGAEGRSRRQGAGCTRCC